MEKPRRRKPRKAVRISAADLEIGWRALNDLKEAGICNPVEIALLTEDHQRVSDAITGTAMVGTAAILFGRGMPATKASDIAESVANDLLDLWWAQHRGKPPKPN